MATDPFPNTSDPTTEQRFNNIFRSLSSVDVFTTDPSNPREGQLWLNKNSGALKIFLNNKTKTLRLEDE